MTEPGGSTFTRIASQADMAITNSVRTYIVNKIAEKANEYVGDINDHVGKKDAGYVDSDIVVNLGYQGTGSESDPVEVRITYKTTDKYQRYWVTNSSAGFQFAQKAPGLSTQVIIPSTALTATGKIDSNLTSVTLTDRLSYTGLDKTKTYTVQTKVYKLKSNGNTAEPSPSITVADKTFTPSSSNGTYDVTFTINPSLYPETNFVVYEWVLLDGTEVVKHTNKSDTLQQFGIDKPVTFSTTIQGNTTFSATETSATITDRITFDGLVAGTYTIDTSIVKKGTNTKVSGITGSPTSVTIDANGYVSGTTNKYIDITITGFKPSEHPDEAFYVREQFKSGSTVKYSHPDSDSQAFSVGNVDKNPRYVTNVTAGKTFTGDETSAQLIEDTISYYDLEPNTNYTISTTVVYNDSNKTTLTGLTFNVKGSSGNTFTTNATGTGEVVIQINGFVPVNYQGKSFYIRENVINVDHNLTEDPIGQKFSVGNGSKKSIRTVVSNQNFSVLTMDAVSITDTVYYENLIPNTQYTIDSYIYKDDAYRAPLTEVTFTVDGVATEMISGFLGSGTFTTNSTGTGTVTVIASGFIPSQHANEAFVFHESVIGPGLSRPLTEPDDNIPEQTFRVNDFTSYQVEVILNKVISNKFIELARTNPNYSINGLIFTLVSDLTNYSPVYDSIGGTSMANAIRLEDCTINANGTVTVNRWSRGIYTYNKSTKTHTYTDVIHPAGQPYFYFTITEDNFADLRPNYDGYNLSLNANQHFYIVEDCSECSGFSSSELKCISGTDHRINGWLLPSAARMEWPLNNRFHVEYTATNPAHMDPPSLQLTKIKPDGSSWAGSTNPAGAQYVVKQYYAKGGEVQNTWVYETKSDGKILFGNVSYYKTQSNTLADNSVITSDPLILNDDGVVAWPLGYYTIQEIYAPAGLKINSELIEILAVDDGNGGTMFQDMDHDSLPINQYYTVESIEEVDSRTFGIHKVDAELYETQTTTALAGGSQGSATLAGAVYGVYTKTNTGFNSSFDGYTITTGNLVNGYYEVLKDGSLLTITIGEDGKGTLGCQVPDSDQYVIKEVTPSPGYKLDTTVYEVLAEDFSLNPTDTNIIVFEEVIKGKIQVVKKDANTADGSAEGAGSLAGISFAIVNNSTNAVYSPYTDSWINPGYVFRVVTTVANGTAPIVEDLPYGTYTIYELRQDAQVTGGANWANANKGTSIYANDYYLYGGSSTTFIDGSFAGLETSKTVNMTAEITDTETFSDVPKRGNLSITKQDYYFAAATPSGDASLAGIRFAVVNRTGKSIVMRLADNESNPYLTSGANGTYADGVIVAIITSNSEGYARLNGLVNGAYDVIELRKDAIAAPGQVYNGNIGLGSSAYANDSYLYPTTPSVRMNVASNTTTNGHGTTINGTVTDAPVTFNISVRKVDINTNGVAEGAGSLAGIRFAIVNNSTNPVKNGTTTIAKGNVFSIITTDANGNASQASLPYGTYNVYELRQDAQVTVNAVWANVNKGSSIMANDYYLYGNSSAIYVDGTTTTSVEVIGHQLYTGNASFTFADAPERFNVTINKTDVNLGTTVSGDGSFDNIYFAVVNRTGNNVVMKAGDNTAANSTVVNGANGTYADGTVIAIIKTTNGSATIRGLVNGNYNIYELRADANRAALVGTAYNGSVNLGTSIYANDSYLYNNTVMSVNATGVHGATFTQTIANTPVKGSMSFYKYDSDYNDHTRNGNASLNGIKYAVVNRSNSTVYNGSAAIAKDAIYAILTSHSNGATEGYVDLANIPYGTYEVIELATNTTATVGAAWNNNLIGNSGMVNAYYKYAAHSETFTITENNANVTLNTNGQTMSFSDPVQTTGFSFWKKDVTGLSLPSGDGSWNNIKYAVVNRSNAHVMLHDVTDAGVEYNDGDSISPNCVVAILTTHTNGTTEGYASLHGLPLGSSYEIFELSSNHTATVGTPWSNDMIGNGNTKGYANDSYLVTDTLNASTTSGIVPAVLNKAITLPTFNGTAVADSAIADYTDSPVRGNVQFWKTDVNQFVEPYIDHESGDTSLNDIRFAIINESQHSVKLYNTYNTACSAYVQLSNGTEIESGHVAAIVTTHANSGRNGFVELYGLPYGTYRIVELRADATIAVGDQYDGTTGIGISPYANATMMYADSYTDDGSVRSTVFTIRNQGETVTGVDNDLITFADAPGLIELKLWKADVTLTDGPSGDSTLNGVRYAIVNRSANPIKVYANNITTNQYIDTNGISYGTQINPGTVVAVLKTATFNGKEGYAAINGLPVGTYEIYELPIDTTVTIGSPLTLGNSIYVGNSSYLYSEVEYPALNTNTYNVASRTIVGATPDTTYTATTFKNTPVRGNITFFKGDKNGLALPSGDGSFNRIKYAIVNNSDHPIVLGGTYNDGVQGIDYTNGAVIRVGQVVAILTTHTSGTNEGFAEIYGLPYGTYGIYELRADATIAVGEDYATSANLGTSKYANASYMYTDKYDSMVVVDNEATYTVESQTESIRVQNTTYTNSAFYNYPVRGKIELTKLDVETMTNYKQGLNTFAGIRFAVVNRSTDPIYYNDTTFAVGTIIDVITTDADGYASISEVPYGTYQICELRMTAASNATLIGKVYDTLTTGQLGINATNDSFKANKYYMFGTQKVNGDGILEITDPNMPTITVHTEQGEVVNINNIATSDNRIADSPVRGDFAIRKIAGNNNKTMGYIPFLISLVEADAEGNPLLDADGQPVNVIESHVFVTGANGLFNSHARSKNKADLNALDAYLSGGEFTGDLTDLPENATLRTLAETANIWFDATALATTDQLYVTGNGSLIYGTYVIQELRATTNVGYGLTSGVISITQANQITAASSEDILVDLKLSIVTDALDKASNSNAVTDGTTVKLLDKVMFSNLSYGDTYGYITRVYVIDNEGNTVSVTDSPVKMIDLGANPDGDKVKNLHEDVNEFTFDTTVIQPNHTIHFETLLYQKIGNTWISYPIAAHNTAHEDEREMLVKPGLTTSSVNETTRIRIGSISPYTVANDNINYWNFGEKKSYLITVSIKDDEGNVVKDENGLDCVNYTSLYTTKETSTLTYKSSSIVGGHPVTIYSGPVSGSFTLDQLGLTKFNIKPDYKNLHFEVLVSDPENMEKTMMIQHNINRDDLEEEISYIQIETQALSGDGLENVLEDNTNAHLTDVITYSNVYQNVDVIIEGSVVTKEGTEVTTATKTVTLSKGEGTVNMDYYFNSHPYAGTDLVVFEKIYMMVPPNTPDGVGEPTKVLIADHSEIDDPKQTVSIPKISTTLVNEHVGAGYRVVEQTKESITLIDYVSYTNVKPEYSWVLTATLMDNNGNPVLNKAGNPVTVTHPFTPSAKDGVEPVTITFDQQLTSMAWDNDISWVCFEDLRSGENGHTDMVYTTHSDLTDEGQTVYLPKFRTTIVDEYGHKQVPAKAGQKVIDTVELKNFEKYAAAGDKFTLVIKAYDAITGAPILDSSNNQYSNSKTFTWNGQTSVDIDVVLDASKLLGRTIVFYETLYFGETATAGQEVLKEETQTNAEQTITVPEMHTNAMDSETLSRTMSMSRIIVDKITLNRITPNTDYVITTKVIDKATGEPIKNNDGTEFKVETNYHSPATSTNALICTHCDTVYAVDDEITINIDISGISGLEGKDLVVYEYMPLYDRFYAEHTNLNDVNQTVEVPKIQTTFIDTATQTHTTAYGTTVEVVDTVTYENLIPGKYYDMICTLMDKNAADVFKVDGNPVTKTEHFQAGADGTGTVEVKFEIDTTLIEGKKLVAFEDCRIDDISVAVHAEIDDEGQTVNVPIIRTTLVDLVIEDHMTAYSETEEVEDTVTYANLVEGRKYIMSGVLYDKATGAPILDKLGNRITGSQEFTAGTNGTGTVKVKYIVDTVFLASKHIVAFEYCTDAPTEVLVGVHTNINDIDQTVGIPDIQTVLTDNLTLDHVTSYGTSVTITDRISYVNLLVMKEYEMTGILYDKTTNAPVLDASGNPITNTVKWTPTESNGTIPMTFTVDTEFLKGHILVAFEKCTLLEKNAVVAQHHNIDDVDQTIYIPEIRTTLVSKDTNEHIAPVVDAEIELIDTVEYFDLLPGKQYKITGTLMNQRTGNPVLIDGNPIVASTTFTPATKDGVETITFKFNSNVIKGTTVVAFEDLTYNDILVTTHSVITDEGQTVDIPDIKTSFFDVELETLTIDGEVRSGQTKASVTLKDIVSYTNLNTQYEYVVTGTLMYKNGNPVLVDGNPITSSTTFTPVTRDGFVEVVFNNVNTNVLEGETIVAFETLKRRNIEIITHADLNDVDQTIQIPKIRTTFFDKLTGDEVVTVGEDIELVDTVAYTNLIVGKTYTLNATLMNKATNSVVKDASNNDITATTTFVAETTNGTVDVTFKLNTALLKGETLVAFESLVYNGFEITTHADINDNDQTVYVPDIRTTLISDDTGIHVAPSVKVITLTDTVTFKNLVIGKSYTLNGTLMDKATGLPILVDGNPVTATETFIPDVVNGTKDITFTFDARLIKGTTLVAFENLLHNGIIVVSHTEIDDAEQTVDIPDIKTSFFDVELDSLTIDGEVRTGQTKTVTLKDIVSYTHLTVGHEYTVYGTIMNKATGLPVEIDGVELKSSTTFTATSSDGTVEVVFNNVDAKYLEGETLVAFETLKYNNVEIAIHADIDDNDQTIKVPKIRTKFFDNLTKDNVVTIGTDMELVDTVTYTNLIVGKTYTLNATLMDKATNTPVKDASDAVITATKTFVPTTADGTVDVVFTVNTSLLKGKTLVAFESLEYSGVEITTHAEITDEDQTVYVPDIRTTLISDDTLVHVAPSIGTITLTDTVTFKNLVVGKLYTLEGTLMNKATGTPILVAGSPVVSTVNFTPDVTDGTVDVTFTFDASLIKGTTLVAYENLYHNGILVISHTDIDDAEQTVDIPDIKTTFYDVEINDVDAGGKEHSGQVKTSVTLKDVVKYTHLTVGHEYTVYGTLMNKKTNLPIEVDGVAITSSTTFTATTSDGEVEVIFANIDTTALVGETIVAFETLKYTDVEIAIHADIEDKDETIKVPEIHTTLVDDKTSDHVVSLGETTLTDTVTYKNLIPGNTYVLKGSLVYIDDASAVLYEGNPVTKEVTFVADASGDGTVDVQFTLDSTGLDGKTMVAFETLEYLDKVIAIHEDLTDKDQTVYVPKIGTTFVDTTTEDHVSLYLDTAVIEDTVAYENLVAGETYTLTSTVMDKATGMPLIASGAAVVATTEFIPDTPNGSVKVAFTLNTIDLEGRTIVAYQTLSHNASIVAMHADITDEGQTVYIPKIRTTLVDSVTTDHVAHTSETTTLIDTITYTDLLPGKEYVASGTLMVKETNEVLKDKDGNPITSSTTFTPTTPNGTIDVVFKFDSSLLEGQSVVAFEKVLYKDLEVAVHADITDENQTVHYPKISTKLVDAATGDEVATGYKYIDTVYYENVIPGYTYTMNGTLLYKSGTALTGGTGSTTFTPETSSGSVAVNITAYAYGGSTVVAYESLVFEGNSIADHKDINDANQTVYIPSVSTSLTSNSTYDRIAPSTGTITLTDSVSYSNVVPGMTYSVSGTLMDKATGLPLTVNGYAVTGSSSFTATSTSGSTSVTFTFDASVIAGKTVVAYETMYHNSVVVASHSDINDSWQTVRIPGIKTSFFDKDLTELVSAGSVRISQTGSNITLVDTVTYENLIPEYEYVVTGTIMDKATNSPIIVNGSAMTASTTFKPTESNGTVDVTFNNVNTEALAGRTLVAFETLSYKGTTLVNHNNINDVDQTIKVPTISTVLTNVATGNDVVNVCGENETIELVDKITYTNLVPGKTYTLNGSLMYYSADGSATEYNPVMFNGEAVTATSTFTPSTSNGTVEMSFTLCSADFTNTNIVAFEVLKYDGYTLVNHSDIADADQTVYVPAIRTVALDDADGDKFILGQSEEETVIDTLYYENLVPGKTYTVIGKLAVKKDYEDGEEIEFVKVGKKDLTSKVKFTPETPNGSVNIDFTFNAADYSGYQLVVMETVKLGDVVVIDHSDLNDVDQTVEVSLLLHVKVAKMDMDNIKYVLEGAEITIFNADGTIALDINGNECIGVTDENGEVFFTVIYDRNNTYYAMETQAPQGYELCPDKFELVPSMDRETLGTCLIPIQIRDRIIIIPPKTGDTMPIIPITAGIVVGILFVGFVVIKTKKVAVAKNTKKRDEEE